MSDILQLGRAQSPHSQSCRALGYSSYSSSQVNGTRRRPPRLVLRQQLPLALLSPARMRRHTAPEAIKSPQRAGEGLPSPPLLSVIDRAIKGSDASALTSAPAGGAGGDMWSPWQRRGAGPAGRGVAASWQPFWPGPAERPCALASICRSSALSTAPICGNLWYRCGAD